jgi:hypothetical protein
MTDKGLLRKHGVEIKVMYSADISFDLDFDSLDGFEREIYREFAAHGLDDEKVDIVLTPGSPASSPYVTMQGSSRALVEREAAWALKLNSPPIRFCKAMAKIPQPSVM